MQTESGNLKRLTRRDNVKGKEASRERHHEVSEVNFKKEISKNKKVNSNDSEKKNKIGINAQIPISNLSCSKCKKEGDSGCFCNSRKKEETKKIVTLHNLDEDFYSSQWTLGTVPYSLKKNKSVWMVSLKLSNKITIFKIDTGASVTVIPLTVYESLGLDEMQPTDMAIFGASGHALDVVGQFTTTISRLGSNKSILCNISVIRGLQQSLLGLEEITALNLVSLNLEDKNDVTTDEVDKHNKLDIKDKSPKNGPKSFISKTQCWQDEFASPYLELGGATFSPAMPFPMLWMARMVDFDNHSKDGVLKNSQKRKHKLKHQRNNNTKMEANYDSIFLTFMLKEMIPGHEPSLTSRQGSNQLSWSRHS